MSESSDRSFGRGRGGGRGDRGRGDRGGRGRGGRGRGRGGRNPRSKEDEVTTGWTPVTKLGRLVQGKMITSLEEIYLFSIPIKEVQIIDWFLGAGVLKDDVMKIMPVQKQTRAGQRTRFKAFVIVGDCAGHVGLGVKCAKEVATAIRGAIVIAKLSIVPIRRGYWGSKFGAPHTVPAKTLGKCGSVRVCLIPAPRGTGIVAAGAPKKLLQFAGMEDVFTASCGSTRTMGNFLKAVFQAVSKTYGYLTPDLWREYKLTNNPMQEYSDYLMAHGKKGSKVGRIDRK